jgi:hypothetical protein
LFLNLDIDIWVFVERATSKADTPVEKNFAASFYPAGDQNNRTCFYKITWYFHYILVLFFQGKWIDTQI